MHYAQIQKVPRSGTMLLKYDLARKNKLSLAARVPELRRPGEEDDEPRIALFGQAELVGPFPQTEHCGTNPTFSDYDELSGISHYLIAGRALSKCRRGFSNEISKS